MLKANVGLSRKLSKDYNSTGFSLNLEGEVNATLDDPEAVIERIRELYTSQFEQESVLRVDDPFIVWASF